MWVVQEKKNSLYQTDRRGRLQTVLDEVEIIPVLHKVTGAGHGCKGGGGGGGAWGCGHWGGGGGGGSESVVKCKSGQVRSMDSAKYVTTQEYIYIYKYR